jgi:hypothetical protein
MIDSGCNNKFWVSGREKLDQVATKLERMSLFHVSLISYVYFLTE